MKFKKLIVIMMPLTSISIEGGYRNCTKNDSLSMQVRKDV